MLHPRWRNGVMIAGWIWWLAVSPAGADQPDRGRSTRAAESAARRARGLHLAYSLDYDEAREALRQAIAADPESPAAYRLLAAVDWLNLLFRNGVVLVDDYLGDAKQTVKRRPPSPDLDAQFHEAIGRALALAERELRDRPHDPDAHYQVGATLGFQTSYMATIEGKVLGGFHAARRAYEEHQRVLELDPGRRDAGLIVGMYRYGVSTLPIHWRLLAQLVGFGGGRERGMHLVEEAATYPADARPEALFTLIVMYSREKRYDAALGVIEQLQREYPRNRLLWLEAGSTALRAGRAAEARRQLEEGLSKLAQDPRPRAYGEEARWHLHYGSVLVALREVVNARHELAAVLTAQTNDWVRGRAHNELGKLADLAGDRSAATKEYELAVRLCDAADDVACVDEAKHLIAVGYR